MSELVLPVQERFFNEIRDGIKQIEYRAYKPYWIEQIEDQNISLIKIVKNGTKGNSPDTALFFDFNGYEITTIDSHFYGNNAKVFAIDLTEPRKETIY